MRRPRPTNCTRRGWPVLASGRGAATIRVMMTSRMFAGALLAPARGDVHEIVGGGGGRGGLSQVYEKIGCAGLFTTFCTNGTSTPEVAASGSAPGVFGVIPRMSVGTCTSGGTGIG